MSQAPIIRVTHDGSQRVADAGGDPYPSSGNLRITGFHDVPEFDINGVIHAHFPGIVVQANLVEAVTLWLIQHGTVNDEDEAAILALANVLLADDVLPDTVPVAQDDYPLTGVPYPRGLLRIPGSNPTPSGWTIVNDEKVVTGLTP